MITEYKTTLTPPTRRAHLTGSIPVQIGALVALSYFDLSGSSIEGTLNIEEMKQLFINDPPVQAP